VHARSHRPEGTANLDQYRLRGTYRIGVDATTLDLGNEPPLSVDGDAPADIDRSRISVQWFSGTILTGLCGAALMGGAVFASLDGEMRFAATPERVQTALRGALGQERVVTRKGDRLPPAGEANASRQVIRVSTTSRGPGEREIVRVRPYVKVATNLSLTSSELSANIPPFNPQRLLTDPGTPTAAGGDEAAATATAAAAAAAPDAEVSFVTRELSPLLPRLKIAAVVPLDDVIARVRDAANWAGGAGGGSGPSTYAVASVSPGKLAYAAEGVPDPYAGFEARIVPENVTLLPKTANTTATNANERTVTVKKGDGVASILRDLGGLPDEIKAIAALLGARGKDGGLKEGSKLRILLSPIAGRIAPVRLVVFGETAVEAVVALSDMGKYVSVDVRSAETALAQRDEDEDEEDDGSGMRLYQSVYETALRNQIPKPVVEDLIRIYSYDVDFQRKAQPGDSFEVLYAGEDDNPDGKNDVLFASLTVGGEVKKFYRYLSADDGVVDYYDETGKSAKKFLVRKPVSNGLMRSGFGSRRHPVLGFSRMHTGVDWAAPMGTPIYAAGNGVIDKVGWEGGYGKYIRMRHPNGYETAYGHMTAYARGMEVGTRVRQGQVIGFVGSTGLSTGAHVHYEILVNGRFVDPMRIKLPRGRVLDGQVLANFERERDRLDGMMVQSPSRVAAQTGAGGR
jgi:murein DD-endopeptidase MepM/ murein hydrolase activator NlpD